jgi:hypothetical protein
MSFSSCKADDDGAEVIDALRENPLTDATDMSAASAQIA